MKLRNHRRHFGAHVDNLLVVSSGTWHSCSQANINNPRGDSYQVPQGSTLAPVLFNIYTSDIPDTVSNQYGYADDLALLFSYKCWNEVEVLALDIQRIAEYLSAWRLRLSTAKTTCTAFHLNNENPAVILQLPSMVPPSPTPVVLKLIGSWATSINNLNKNSLKKFS